MNDRPSATVDAFLHAIKAFTDDQGVDPIVAKRAPMWWTGRTKYKPPQSPLNGVQACGGVAAAGTLAVVHHHSD